MKELPKLNTKLATQNEPRYTLRAEKPDVRFSAIDGKVFKLTEKQISELREMAERFEHANEFGTTRTY